MDTDAPDTEDSRTYVWTIRALYALAIGLNVWIMIDQLNEANPTRLPLLKAKVEAWARRDGDGGVSSGGRGRGWDGVGRGRGVGWRGA